MVKIEYLICLIPATYSAYTDLTKRTLYNVVTIPIFLTGVVYSICQHAFFNHFVTALVVFAILFALAWKGGISGGDVKFVAALAMWFGYPNTIYLVLIGSVLAVLFGFANWVRLGIFKTRMSSFVKNMFFRIVYRIKTDEFQKLPDNEEISPEGIPFGTFLALGAWAVFILNLNGYAWPI